MKWFDEIARVARELYEQSGRIEGRDLDNWLEAERIVMERYEKQKSVEADSSSKRKKLKKNK